MPGRGVVQGTDKMRGVNQREQLLGLGRCEEVVFGVVKVGAGGHHPQPVETVLVTGQKHTADMVEAAVLAPRASRSPPSHP